MPQLDLSTYIGQIFWLVLSFFLLFFLFAKIFIPMMAQRLDQRRTSLDIILEEAKLAHDSWKKEQDRQEKERRYVKEKIEKDLEVFEKQLRADFARQLQALSVRLESEQAAFAKNVEDRQKEEIGKLAHLVGQEVPNLAQKITGISLNPKTAEETTRQILEDLRQRRL